jgi:hypothetical protein
LGQIELGEPIALVIANSQYEKETLKQPINDAIAMKTVLTKLGFRVIFKKELKKRFLNLAIVDFKRCLQISKDIGLFYFTGYGIQLDKKNYLLPINISIEDKHDVESDAFPVNKKLLSRLEDADNKLNIIILDACRENFYCFGDNCGLANMTAPSNFIIAYPTAAGQTIKDKQEAKNSLYIRILVEALEIAGQNHDRVYGVFEQVGNTVSQKSQGQQVPLNFHTLTKKFCFGGCKKLPKLKITSNAEGAVVFLDGNLSGRIQDGKYETEELPVGPYNVELEKDGYIPSELKKVNLQSTQTIKIELKKVPNSPPAPEPPKPPIHQRIMPYIGF